MLVRETDGVTDLVDGRVDFARLGNVPPEIHGSVVATLPKHLAPYVRPRAVVAHEPDADLCFAPADDFLEFEPDSNILPFLERLVDNRLFGLGRNPRGKPRRAVFERDILSIRWLVEEVVMQHRAVDPFGLVDDYESGAVGRDAR